MNAIYQDNANKRDCVNAFEIELRKTRNTFSYNLEYSLAGKRDSVNVFEIGLRKTRDVTSYNLEYTFKFVNPYKSQHNDLTFMYIVYINDGLGKCLDSSRLNGSNMF